MNLHGIEFEIKNRPVLDETFAPVAKFCEAYLAEASIPLAIALERNSGLTYVFETRVRGDEYMEANRFYVERMVKLLLWCVGGWKVTICGDRRLASHIREIYHKDGARAFDADLMGSKAYGIPFEVCWANYEERPKAKDGAVSVGRNVGGRRIGFDAGGSDRKVSAVVDGVCVYSEEVVWHPKEESDPAYHYGGIVEAFKTAASKMGGADAIGVSSAGIYVDNYTRAASLFIKVSPEDFEKYAKDIYIRAAKEIGDVPLCVCNDGDVTALAGAIGLDDVKILGIAMGTSEAGGYVDKNGNITGWLNELAFAPCDLQPDAARDEWSGDSGCGAKYFSQDAVIRLAPGAKIHLDEKSSLGERLKTVQAKLAEGDRGAEAIFKTIGAYLGHTVATYGIVYDMKHILLMGRVTSGRGGDITLETAKEVMKNEYSGVCSGINIQLPDEKSRRVGQSVAAASLPKI